MEFLLVEYSLRFSSGVTANAEAGNDFEIPDSWPTSFLRSPEGPLLCIVVGTNSGASTFRPRGTLSGAVADGDLGLCQDCPAAPPANESGTALTTLRPRFPICVSVEE